MKHYSSTFLLLCLILLGCISYAQTPHYGPQDQDWQKTGYTSKVSHTMYLIGDAGEVDSSVPYALNILKYHLAEQTDSATVIVLGDNSYQRGLLPFDDPDSAQSAENLQVQFRALSDFNGPIFFIPGNHDWTHWSKKGWEGIKREEKYVEQALNKGNSFLPDLGCPGPVVVEVNKDLILVIIDTQWWLHEFDKPSGQKDSCTVANDADFIAQIKDVIEENSDKQILVVGHHPLVTNGEHGGYYSIKDHIFPLTAKWHKLYIPLPVLGSIYPLYRKHISSIQDLGHPRYQLLIEQLQDQFRLHDHLIYAAGHEHNLQFIQEGTQNYIVSGSGSKSRYVAKKKNGSFAYAEQGFSKVLYLENGEVWVEFWAVSDIKNNKGVLVFRKKIKDANPVDQVEEKRLDYSDSSVWVVGGANYGAGKFHSFMLGKHYRQAWLTPIEVPLIDLSTEKGGLTPIKLGGGFQTKSMRLENPSGQQYIFRSVQKYPRKILDEELRQTWVGDIMQDQISMAHPYGALVVPNLAEAVDIYHKKSQLVFVPDDPLLGKYRSIYKNTLAIYEMRANKGLSEIENFGHAEKAIGTPDLIEKMHKSHNHVVDERNVLKNRLFDMWLGDWDRHDDQWRWAKLDCDRIDHSNCFHEMDEKSGTGTVYRPIPRDRDQVFVQLDGVFIWYIRQKWMVPKLAHFDYKIKNVEGLNINGRPIDRTMLSGMTRADWMESAKYLQEKLTDSIIENAFTNWPDTLQKLDAPIIIAKLKVRRDDLIEYANTYYDILAKEVEVTGSDKKEWFVVERLKNGNTLVSVYKSKDFERSNLLFKREFLKDETKDIYLYGFGGDDHFIVSGQAKKGINVRIIGGPGEDEVVDKSKVNGWCKKTKIYDKPGGLKIESDGESKDLSADDSLSNAYTREHFKSDVLAPKIVLGYNIDDGAILGAGFHVKNYGWRKTPYANDHSLQIATATYTNALILKYKAHFNQLIGDWNLILVGNILAPDASSNFYGLGNMSSSEFGHLYYRYQFNQVEARSMLAKKINRQEFKFGLSVNLVDVEHPLENRITKGAFFDLPLNGLIPNYMTGLHASHQFNSTDNSVLPTKGVVWNNQIDHYYNSFGKHFNTNLSSDLSVFLSGNGKVRPTLAARIGGSTLFNDYQFYQSNVLGAQTRDMRRGNLRGYRRDRFSGRSMVYQNTDLRIRLFTFRSYLFPGQFGIMGFSDHGRVWIDNENSNIWHHSYGGGVWLSPAQLLVITANLEKSPENEMISVHMNFIF
jgi:hypothetical protein